MSIKQRHRFSILKTVIIGALVVTAGASCGFWISEVLPSGTLISFLKYSTVLLGVVWAFSMTVYSKLSDLTDLPGINYKQHRGLESAIQVRLHWFWYRATLLGVAGLAANLPMFIRDGGNAPKPWAFAIAVGSLALAMFLLRRVWAELEDIRELRADVKELERRELQRTDQIRRLKEGASEWEPDSKLAGLGPGGDPNGDAH